MAYLRDKDVMIAFGRHLVKARKFYGLTQKELSYKSDIDVSQISRIERGLINTSISTAYLLAQGMGISLSKLCDFKIK